MRAAPVALMLLAFGGAIDAADASGDRTTPPLMLAQAEMPLADG